MSYKIDTVSARAKLACRREPYWQRISAGCFIGFRKMTPETDGVWQVRYHNSDRDRGQLTRTLGALDEIAPSLRYDKAMLAAREWLLHIGIGGAPERTTVMDACDAYERIIREMKGASAADDLRLRYKRWVEPSKLARIELSKLTRDNVNDFRRQMVDTPVSVGKSGATRARSKDTVNRDIAAVRAALNKALEDGETTSDFAWRKPLGAFKNVSKRRELYLDKTERGKLIQHAPSDLAPFIRCLSMLPLRPGALAALRVADFDDRIGVLRIGKDKTGRDRKLRVPSEIAKLIREAQGGRPHEAPLFARMDGSAWNKDAWKKPVKAAAAGAALPANTIAYSLRHSAISDLVHGGLDLLTVAQISGTSVAMIEKHYGHLRSDVAALALAKLAL